MTVLNSFSQADTRLNIYYCGNLSFDVTPLSIMTYRLPGSLKQTRGSGCLSWQPNDSARFRLGHILWPLFISSLLPEASFGLRVLSLPASVCVSVRPSVRVCGNHLLVRAITRDPFKLGSPNLDQRCKRPWLRSLLFWGQLTLTFKVKFNLKLRIYPILSLSAP